MKNKSENIFVMNECFNMLLDPVYIGKRQARESRNFFDIKVANNLKRERAIDNSNSYYSTTRNMMP